MKACMCCGRVVGRLKRVCPSCKVPAIWRPLTDEELKDRAEKRAKADALLEELMNGA